MSYFKNHSRVQSNRLTEAETAELKGQLSQLSAQDLRLIISSAASGSPDVAHRIINVMRDNGFIPSSHLQPVQPRLPNACESTEHSRSGLLTPTDISDDSEMSGTENIQPEPQHHHLIHCDLLGPTVHIDHPRQFASNTISLKRNNKRKTFADTTWTTSDNPYSSHQTRSPATLSKRPKPIIHNSNVQQPPTSSPAEKTHCLNCGTYTSSSAFENQHSCIYHPGTFEFDGRVTVWSCCGNGAVKSRGCLITRHRGVGFGEWVFGNGSGTGVVQGQSGMGVNGADCGISQYARLISTKG